VTARRPTPLLEELQRTAIFEAFERADFDKNTFDLADDGTEVRVENTLSASCFTLSRDKTWRYLGTYFVGDGPERPFDRSWRAVIPLMNTWLAEVKGEPDAPDTNIAT
jgi:hypothetical protein